MSLLLWIIRCYCEQIYFIEKIKYSQSCLSRRWNILIITLLLFEIRFKKYKFLRRLMQWVTFSLCTHDGCGCQFRKLQNKSHTQTPITHFQFQVNSIRAVTSSSQGVLLLSSEPWSVVDRIRQISSFKRVFKSCSGKHFFLFMIWMTPICCHPFADNGSLYQPRTAAWQWPFVLALR